LMALYTRKDIYESSLEVARSNTESRYSKWRVNNFPHGRPPLREPVVVGPIIPVSYPTLTSSRIIAGAPCVTSWTKRSGERQSKPIDRALNYTAYFCETRCQPGRSPSNPGWALQSDGWSDPIWTNANSLDSLRSKAYGNMKDSAYESVQLGTNLAEWSQSSRMISSAASTLLGAVRDIRRGDLLNAARKLRLKAKPANASIHKSFANNWLEYHFGWAPLCSDIYGAANVFQEPMKSVHISGRSTTAFSTRDGSASNPQVNQRWTDTSHKGVCRQGAYVTVSNPNLHLMDQLGVINPLSIAWELVPFSFVVDWFANVGQCLNSLTDFAGCSVSMGYTTYFYRGEALAFFRQGTYPNNPPDPYAGDTWVQVSVRRHMERRPGWTLPSLSIKPIRTPSITRAATAISLLAQNLR